MNRSVSSLNSLRKAYERFWENEELAKGTREEMAYYRWMLDLLGVGSTTKLLDIACGGGHCLNEARAKKANGFGIDIAYAALQRSLVAYELRDLVQASSEDLPFPNDSFDVVTCLGSLEHFFDPSRAIHEICRVVGSTGRVGIVLPNQWSFVDVVRGWRHGLGITHSQDLERFYALKEAKALLANNGLVIHRTLKYNKPTSGPTGAKFRKLGPLNLLYHSTYPMWRRWIPLTASYSFVFICTKGEGTR
ncbi:MAG: class I SAM-dependent methyltransferase [Chloroflexi bacterium]|nr:class I SAM-dependent methyltransferase [Chloroflexota bacterium]